MSKSYLEDKWSRYTFCSENITTAKNTHMLPKKTFYEFLIESSFDAVEEYTVNEMAAKNDNILPI